jgi:hypothetical protein
VLNRILTEIENGVADGTYYTVKPRAETRAAWLAVHKIAPHKSEQQCRNIIRAWAESGLLYETEYRNQVTRKMATGLRVDNSKRPGSAVRV